MSNQPHKPDTARIISGTLGGLALKSSPPQASPGFLVRPHLALDRFRLVGIQLLEVNAPHGFGKTSQLSQWHREATAAGLLSMWLTLDERDDVSRLIQGLTMAAVKLGVSGGFSREVATWIGSCGDPQEALTVWLSEVAQAPATVLLLLDDVDLLPAQSRSDVIEYLFANAPGNLIVALSARPGGTIVTADTLRSAPVVRVTARELRFREDETVAMVRDLVGEPDAPELAVRIQTLSEGWPLGVRLAIASRLQRDDKGDTDVAASADLDRYFLDRIIDPLPPATRNMLAALAHLDPIHIDLCRDAMGTEAPVDELDRLADESPILTRSEGGWLRLHPVARALLGRMHEDLPEDTRRTVATRACQWYQTRGLLEEAAHQADIAGTHDLAMQLAEASVREMTLQGRNNEVLEWFGQLSQDEIDQRPSFWAPTAWALAMSDRPQGAIPLVERIFARPGIAEDALFEAHLILASVAGFRDDLTQLEQFRARWPAAPGFANVSERIIHATAVSNGELLNGETERTRLGLSGLSADSADMSPVSRAFADLLIGMSYLWEGNSRLAYESLQPALVAAEMRLGRLSRVVSMLAAACAQACIETGRPDEARLQLTLRTSILERFGLPDAVMAGFRALAQLAQMDGRQDQASDHLARLVAVGRSRDIARLEAAALLDLTLLHVQHRRANSALQSARELEGLAKSHEARLAGGTRSWLRLHARLARANAFTLSEDRSDLLAGEAAAREAERLATQLNRGRERVLAKFVLADLLERLGDVRGTSEREEAVSLCTASGMDTVAAPYMNMRTLHDPHRTDRAVEKTPRSAASATDRPILTPREQDVLLRLSSRLSNKEMALSMGLGEETIKWHVRNLLHKLDATDRKDVVSRARILGLIAGV